VCSSDLRDDPTSWYLKLGQKLDVTSLGMTAVSIDFMAAENHGGNGTKGESYGIGVVQKIDALGTEIYGTVRQWDADIPTIDTESVTIAATGARIKF